MQQGYGPGGKATAELWVLTAVGAGTLLLGFTARLAFDRWRIPDFLVLILAGMAVGPAGANLVAPDVREPIDQAAPLLLAVAVAFIMFEAGLNLQRLRGAGGNAVLLLHTFASGALTFLLVWWVASTVFALSTPSALVLAAAVLGPSAVVISSFAHRLRVSARTKRALIVEGVIANVIAFFLVTSLAPSTASPGGASFVAGGAALALAVFMALGLGLLWTFAVRALHSREGVLTATLAVALGIYALSNGVIGGHGAVAVFAFGALLGRLGLFGTPEGNGAEPGDGQTDLSRFHGEVTFLVRTFFFLYLGLVFEPSTVTANVLALSITLLALFFLARLPSAWLLGQVWRLPEDEVILVTGTVSRGLSDTVVVLFAISVGLVPPAEAGVMAAAIVLLLLLSVAATAVVVWVAEEVADKDLPSEASRDGGGP